MKEYIFDRENFILIEKPISQFLGLMNIVKYKLGIVKDPINKIWEEKANLFLENNEYATFLEMVKSGYEPSITQIRKLERDIFYIEEIDKINQFITKGYKLKAQKILTLFNDHPKLLEYILSHDENKFEKNKYRKNLIGDINLLEIKPLVNEVNRVIGQKSFPSDFFKKMEWSEWSLVSSSALMILNYRKAEILNNISYDEVLKNLTNLSVDNEDDSFTNFKTQINEYYSQDINLLMDNIKANNIEKLTVEKINNESYTLNTLPNDANNIIKNIENMYKKIKSQEPEYYQLDNLLYKTIPSILQKYLKLDESYRETLTNNQGFNAKELMMDSLKEIELQFNEKNKLINQEHVKKLSIDNKYIKSVKLK